MNKTTKRFFFLYKTSVKNECITNEFKTELNKVIGNGFWNFDFDDDDNILRIICDYDARVYIENLLINRMGYVCIELHYLPNETACTIAI